MALLAGFWKLLTSKLAGPICATLALALAVTLTATRISAAATEAGLRTQLATVQQEITAPVTGWAARLSACQTARQQLDSDLTRQTNAVTAMKRERDAAVAESAKALQAAKNASRIAGQQATAVLNAKSGADQCASAFDLLRGVAP